MARNVSTLKKKPAAIAPDAIVASPEVYRVTFENDFVRVLDIRLKKGTQSKIHSHPDYLAYALSPCKLRFSSIKGEAGEIDIRAGETMWRDAETHSAENVGDDCRALNIEFKKIPRRRS